MLDIDLCTQVFRFGLLGLGLFKVTLLDGHPLLGQKHANINASCFQF